jgi:S-adenosylmethionine:tRNA ribosyltransferase-isomerase
MRLDALHYELPPELIAQQPATERELARLLVMADGDGPLEHVRVSDLPDRLAPGSLVVINDTRVLPSRLFGRKRDSGGRVELFLLRRIGTRDVAEPGDSAGETRSVQVWRALGKASKPLKFGADIDIAPRLSPEAPAILRARLLGRAEDDGLLEVGLWTPSGEPIDAAIRAAGHVPLPPYIKREDSVEDDERYQTVYARHDGAVAAPTAGLHITNALLGRLAVRGCEMASVTLHVGLGTFQPVTVDDLDAHVMHSERFTITQSTADAVARARARGAPIVAIGTTTARALESAADPTHPGHVRATSDETRLLIQPGYPWRVVDTLFTNFHLPCSTLLAMVTAFGGHARVMAAYRAAVREQYRFFSYGDAMLLRRAP